MVDASLLENILKDDFTRQDILRAAYLDDNSFKETQLRNLISSLLNEKSILRVGHNHYSKNNGTDLRHEYQPTISEEASNVIKAIKEDYPFVKFQVLELRWLNEFLNHLVARNTIFVNVENDGCEFVYSSLRYSYDGIILLRPSIKEIEYYSDDNCVIVDRLVSESPLNDKNPNVSTLEKIIVDLFSNKALMTMVSRGDYPAMLDNIFSKYQVNQSKLFRYARRRNKSGEIKKYIKANTKIKLIEE